MKKMALVVSTIIMTFLAGNSFAQNHENQGPGHSGDHHKLCPIFLPISDVCAQIEFTKGPFNGDESQFIIKFFEHQSAHGEHVMVDPQNLKIDLWMNMGHHGHGSSPVKIVKQDRGVYYVSEVYFVMPGRWSIRFFGNGEKTELPVDVKP